MCMHISMKKGTMEEVQKIADYNRGVFIALGLDKKNTNLCLGSSYQLDPKYMLDVLKLARSTRLTGRGEAWMKWAGISEDPKVSQMIYPLMQALDIAHLGVDVAVGGIDQRKIHIWHGEGLAELGYKAPVLHTYAHPSWSWWQEDVIKQGQLHFSWRYAWGYEKENERGVLCWGRVKDNPVLALFNTT